MTWRELTKSDGAGAEDILRLEDKVIGLPPYKEPVGFLFSPVFSNNFAFAEFCNICYFEFLNYVFTKNLEIDSSFLKFFISNFWKNQIQPTGLLKTK
jgi:hypothetical protein